MNENQIESLPAALESDYGIFRNVIRERLSDALENGDAIQAGRVLIGDMLRALSHTLNEYDAPDGTLETITANLI
jgi:hypothetical protein